MKMVNNQKQQIKKDNLAARFQVMRRKKRRLDSVREVLKRLLKSLK